MTEGGGHKQITLWHVLDAKRPILFRGLSEKTLAGTHHVAVGTRCQRVAGKPPEYASALRDVQRSNPCAKEGCEEIKYMVCKPVQALLALYPLVECHLAGAKPHLRLARPVVA